MALSPHIPLDQIPAFCRRWRVREFSLFGSALRADFGPESDIDVLVVFEPGVRHDLNAWLAMESELESLFGREIDLVERRQITNPFRRHEILTTKRVLYAA